MKAGVFSGNDNQSSGEAAFIGGGVSNDATNLHTKGSILVPSPAKGIIACFIIRFL